MSTKDFQITPKKQKEPVPLVPDSNKSNEQLEDDFVRARERTTVKTIRIPESLNKKLKYYALKYGRTEADVITEVINDKLANFQIPQY